MKNVAKIIILNSENKLLLHLRDNKKDIPFPNSWALIGGGIDEGETPMEAIKREAKEELSCPVKDISFIGEAEEKDFGVHLFFFKGRVSEKIENIKVFEGQRACFFDLTELKNIQVPGILIEFINKNKNKIFS